MRLGRVLLAGVLVVGCALLAGWALAGCGGPAAGADRTPVPTPSPIRWPAATAGGACQLLDYDVIAATTGTSFDVAAASQSGATFSCVLEQVGASLPDLSLSVTPTQASAAIFASTITPKGAAAVPKLGRQGYQAMVAAGAGAGPGVEVGWLSGDQRLIVLRQRTVAGTPPAEVTALAPGLVALAKRIDTASS